jgi:leader peptidase (prepilin peptidase)/N-methyltransferase
MAHILAAISVFLALACGIALPHIGQVVTGRVLLDLGAAPTNCRPHKQQCFASAIAASVLCVACLITFGITWAAASAFMFCLALLMASLIDHQHHLLPDAVTLPLLWLGLLVNVAGTFVSAQDAIIGAVAGYLGLRLVSVVTAAFGGQDGIGGGDFKLLAAIGAWLGLQALLPVTLIAASVGVARGLWLRYHGDKNARVAYGPGLALGAGVMLFYHIRSL